MTSKRIADSTKAVFIDTLKNGSPEWLELRRSGIGGSEVGTILGLNRWESPYTLWAKKTGRIDESVGASEAMEWGNRLEPVILDKFEESHPDLTLHREVGTWSHPEREWQRANPDGIFETADGEFGIVEVKTSQFEDDWTAGVPRYYETQVQWYLQTFGFASAYVVALFHGNRYREYEVTAEGFTQEVNLEAVEQFRKFLVEDIAPDFDGSTSTYETVRAQHPEIDSEGSVELEELGVDYFDLVDVLSEAERAVTEAKSRILSKMGTAKRGLIDGEWVLTRQARGQGAPYLVTKRG